MMPWSKLDANVLDSGAEKFEKALRKLTQKLPAPESIPPFSKLKAVIEGFRQSLPLITSLKQPFVQERHWKKIMEETGKDLGEINLKTITLSKVFELELHHYEEKVRDICTEAKEEAKNEENIQKIENAWKTLIFEIVPYKKGNEVKGHAIKATDDIRTQLENDILLLQVLNASKYIRAFKTKVGQWEKDLNTISDVIDAWLMVQRKWMYLESIFASDDIRMQLPDEAKKFAKTDNNYKKIMETASKNPNVL
jgi:dynein heavy chain